jgi:hypothetical protein
MPYTVTNKRNTWFVTEEVSGKVEGKFFKERDEDNKAAAEELAQKLADKEKSWRDSIKTRRS